MGEKSHGHLRTNTSMTGRSSTASPKPARSWHEGRELLKKHQANADFELLDKEVDNIVWKFANLFPGCLIKSIDGIRQKKKFFWDTTKNEHRHWLAANMSGEAFLGFGAFNYEKDHRKRCHRFHQVPPKRGGVPRPGIMDMFAEVLGKPKK